MKDVDELESGSSVEAAGGLIQQDDRRVDQQLDTNADALAFAACDVKKTLRIMTYHSQASAGRCIQTEAQRSSAQRDEQLCSDADALEVAAWMNELAVVIDNLQ